MAVHLIDQIMRVLENGWNYENKNTSICKRYFVMCKSCYWCLSCLTKDSEHITTCSLCNAKNMELLPISLSESYRFVNDQTGGIGLEFWTENEGDKPS
jgi:hypothetical protein